LTPSHTTSAPTQSQSEEPTVSTLEPTDAPTQVPSILGLERTSAPTLTLFISALDPTYNSTDSPSTGTPPPPTPGAKCGCKYCVNLLSAMADGYTCSDRIFFLRVEWGMSERQACYTVAGYEYPEQCSAARCDPTQCVLIDEDGADNAPLKPPTTASPTSRQPTAFPIANAATVAPAPPTMKPTLRPTQPPSRAPTPYPTVSPVPTSTPSQRPTSLRLTLAGNDGQPDGTYPLNRCQGDCDRK
jgi:hypothetical protein